MAGFRDFDVPRWVVLTSVGILLLAMMNGVGGVLPGILLAVIAGVFIFRAWRTSPRPTGPPTEKRWLEKTKHMAVMLSRQDSMPGPLNEVLAAAVADHEQITVLLFQAGLDPAMRVRLTREIDERMQKALDLALEAPAHLGTSSDGAFVQMERYQAWLSHVREMLEARAPASELRAFVLGKQEGTLIES